MCHHPWPLAAPTLKPGDKLTGHAAFQILRPPFLWADSVSPCREDAARPHGPLFSLADLLALAGLGEALPADSSCRSASCSRRDPDQGA